MVSTRRPVQRSQASDGWGRAGHRWAAMQRAGAGGEAVQQGGWRRESGGGRQGRKRPPSAESCELCGEGAPAAGRSARCWSSIAPSPASEGDGGGEPADRQADGGVGAVRIRKGDGWGGAGRGRWRRDGGHGLGEEAVAAGRSQRGQEGWRTVSLRGGCDERRPVEAPPMRLLGHQAAASGGRRSQSMWCWDRGRRRGGIKLQQVSAVREAEEKGTAHSGPAAWNMTTSATSRER